MLAGQLLREDPGQHLPRSPSELSQGLHRVARLRDELHITANRVARFSYDERPCLNPVRIAAPIASSAVLGPAPLLFQLDLVATRLVEQLNALSAADWRRPGRMGDRVVTLGDLVEGVVHTGTNDLVDLLHPAEVALQGVALPDDRRTRRDRRGFRRLTYSPIAKGHWDATAP